MAWQGESTGTVQGEGVTRRRGTGVGESEAGAGDPKEISLVRLVDFC